MLATIGGIIAGRPTNNKIRVRWRRSHARPGLKRDLLPTLSAHFSNGSTDCFGNSCESWENIKTRSKNQAYYLRPGVVQKMLIATMKERSGLPC